MLDGFGKTLSMALVPLRKLVGYGVKNFFTTGRVHPSWDMIGVGVKLFRSRKMVLRKPCTSTHKHRSWVCDWCKSFWTCGSRIKGTSHVQRRTQTGVLLSGVGVSVTCPWSMSVTRVTSFCSSLSKINMFGAVTSKTNLPLTGVLPSGAEASVTCPWLVFVTVSFHRFSCFVCMSYILSAWS